MSPASTGGTTPALSPAVVARSALVAVTRADVVTYPCGGPLRRHRSTAALVAPERDGAAAGAALPALDDVERCVLDHLRHRPVLTLRLRARGFGEVTLHARTGPGARRGLVALDVLAVKVAGAAPVPLADFRAAAPDPLARTSGAVLAHLDRHAADLRRCLRAQGVDAAWATPAAVDAGGVDVLAVTPDGVTRHRLAFDRPVRDVDDVDPAYRPFLRIPQPPP